MLNLDLSRFILAAMVLGLIYGMVDHTYFMDLLILYAVLAAKFAVMFGVTWAISKAFREKLKPREKVDIRTSEGDGLISAQAFLFLFRLITTIVHPKSMLACK